MVKLKNCPFCGGEAELIRRNTSYTCNPTTIRDAWQVKCKECGIYKEGYSHIYQNEEGEVEILANGAYIAINLWNTREGEDEISTGD